MKSNFNKLLSQANKAISNLKAKEDALANIFQPYFNDEISVLYQESDGFVVLHNTDCENENYANLNPGVKEVFENIQSDKNYYKNKY
jgi:hypothetical protein